jgi:hypothetical protein
LNHGKVPLHLQKQNWLIPLHSFPSHASMHKRSNFHIKSSSFT